MECEYCKIIKKEKEALIIYEDELFIAFLSEDTIIGHTIIIPKNHYIILEMVKEDNLKKIGGIINKISLSIIESINALGMNVIINNGTSAKQKIPHFSIELIPRKENDNVNFFWSPKQISQEEINEIHPKLKELIINSNNLNDETINNLNNNNNNNNNTKINNQKNKKTEEENYLIKSLNRIP
ncbi:MAG: HIT family protein [Nanoarchaeota archaeon]